VRRRSNDAWPPTASDAGGASDASVASLELLKGARALRAALRLGKRVASVVDQCDP